MGSLFGCFFVGRSFPITDTHFARVDATHWVLDVCSAVTPAYWELKEVALFLLQPNTLDSSAALGLYVKTGHTSGDWLYRGYVHNTHPSEWPEQGESGTMKLAGPAAVQIGISVEPAAELVAKEGSRLGSRLDFGKRVGLDLFHFLESFASRDGENIVIPGSALNRWLIRFQEKLKRDPDYLTRKALPE